PQPAFSGGAQPTDAARGSGYGENDRCLQGHRDAEFQQLDGVHASFSKAAIAAFTSLMSAAESSCCSMRLRTSDFMELPNSRVRSSPSMLRRTVSQVTAGM